MPRKVEVQASITQEEFDEACRLVLGDDFYKCITNRTTRQNNAINKMFMEEWDTSGDLEKVKAAATIREAALNLQINGFYKFKK